MLCKKWKKKIKILNQKLKTNKKKFVKKNGKNVECVNQDCKFRKPYRKSTGVTCPKCGKGTIVERKSKRGTVFYGCDKYPDCNFVLWNEPTGEKCPECGSLLVKKVLKKGTVISCSNIKCSYKKTEDTENQTEQD